MLHYSDDKIFWKIHVLKVLLYWTISDWKLISYWKTIYWQWQKRQRCISSNSIWKKSTKTAVLNRPLQLLISLGLSTSENVKTIKKDKSNPWQSIIEKRCDIAPDQNIGNRRLKSLVARNRNIMNILMFEQWDIEF